MGLDARLEEFALRLGYRFERPERLAQALTHKSYTHEHPAEESGDNERLEFLGDAVLDLAVSQVLFEEYGHLPEGEMTRVRAEIVSEGALADVARRLGMGEALRLGRGEERSGGRDKSSLLANAFEAVLGAVFCDGGYAGALSMVRAHLYPDIAASARRKAGVDYKSRLQEHFQGCCGRPPAYRLIAARGPDHDRRYEVEALFDGKVIGQGSGRTKKAAEQSAACEALQALEASTRQQQ